MSTGGGAAGRGGTSATGTAGAAGTGSTGAAGSPSVSCANGTHACLGTCVSNNSINSCGASCNPCVPPTGGTATCNGTQCGFDCGSQRKCTNKCVPQSGCCADADCPTMNGMVGQCDTSANACRYMGCATGFKPCGTSCIASNACCSASDCTGTCQTCPMPGGTCTSVRNADDTDSCAGTCDANGACKSRRGQTCNTVSGRVHLGQQLLARRLLLRHRVHRRVHGLRSAGDAGDVHGGRVRQPARQPRLHGRGHLVRRNVRRPLRRRVRLSDRQLRQRQLLGIDDVERGHLQQRLVPDADGTGVPEQPHLLGQRLPDVVQRRQRLRFDPSLLRRDLHPEGHQAGRRLRLRLRPHQRRPAALLGAADRSARGTTPAAIAGLPSGDAPTQIGGGYHHSCAVLQSGAVYCWGDNGSGQLGNQSTTGSTGAVKVNGLSSGARYVAAGGDHSCAILSDSSVWCWGGNASGQVGTGALSERELDAKAGRDVDRHRGRLPAAATPARSTRTNGVRCWGSNFYGELGTATIPTMEPFESATPVTADLGGGSVAGLAGGVGAHACTLLSTGAVRCWGSNFAGELGDGTAATSAPYGRTPQSVSGISGTVSRLFSGYYMGCALTTSNALWCWGDNAYGNIGTGSATNQIFRPTQASVLGARRTNDFGVGKYHVCVLADNGSVWCWGGNFDGQLGNGTTLHSAAAVQVKGW